MAEHAISRVLARHRNALIAASVVLFHVGALWALQSGLLRRVDGAQPMEDCFEAILKALGETK